MSIPRLTSEQLVRAVQIFIHFAYGDQPVPAQQQHFCRLTPDMPVDAILAMRYVQSRTTRDGRTGFALRIGNIWYPHMKLTVMPVGEDPGFVFGVDTHDMFLAQRDAPQDDPIRLLVQRNQELARTIERAWEQSHLPTQHSILRDYLDHGNAASQPPSE